MEYLEVFGECIPKIGLGTWQMHGSSCRRSVRSALEMGYQHIDTAELYNNEVEVGQAIRDSGVDREDIFLVSKAWSNHLGRDSIQKAYEDSLRRLDMEYIDLYLVHRPNASVPLEETIAGLQRLVESGKIRAMGVSNFSVSQLDQARSIASEPIFTNQVEYHPFHHQDDLLAYCQTHGLALTAYSPLYRGRVLGHETLQKIGERYGKSAAQVALRWVIQQEYVITIPKASSESHQRANLQVFDFELTAVEMGQIKDLR
jgi:diketogulonate reductase-like aldo/keto reductase